MTHTKIKICLRVEQDEAWWIDDKTLLGFERRDKFI